MEIKLNQLLALDQKEYSDWTVCLNNAVEGGIYSLRQDRNHRLMTHISFKTSSRRAKSFRVIKTKFCLQFVRLDRDCRWDEWLFLGAFEVGPVISTPKGNEIEETYDLKAITRFSEFQERLIIRYKKKPGDTQARIDVSKIESIPVSEILLRPYAENSRAFPGFDKLSLSFSDLKTIVNNNIGNWRELLSNANCVYVITDHSDGKLYIGSTYGCSGIWQRWSTYVFTGGSGHDKELDALISKDPEHADKYFWFTALEVFPQKDGNQQFILERERYWTRVFQTIKFGHNTH